MSDILSNGLSWLNGQRHEHLSRTGIYARSGVGSVEVRLTPGETEVEALDGEGFPITARLTDWLVREADLVIAEQAIEPRKGDQVTIGGVQFEVLPVGDHGCYRHTDASRLTLRIHTKEVAP